MNLKEHENNYFTKENNDIEKYLIRIIQRYFSVEDNLSRESIEAIIVESLARFKQSVIGLKGFLFSLNSKTGNITLTISDFNGEKSFNKNSAFNKNFGNDADTICEGNDKRLSDNREPLSHVHTISNIKELEKLLNLDEITTNFHIHKNKKVLDILKYTGAKTKIDLIILEHLQDSINNYIENTEAYGKELKTLYQQYIEILNDCIIKVNNTLQYADEIINSFVPWLNQSYDYVDAKIINEKLSIHNLLIEYASKQDEFNASKILNSIQHIVSEGEFKISTNSTSIIPVNSSVEITDETGQDVLQEIYNNGLRFGYDDWSWDETNKSFIYESNEYKTYPMFIKKHKVLDYTHRVTLSSANGDDDIISVILAYNQDTGDNLSLLISAGDVKPEGMTGATATVALNFEPLASAHSILTAKLIVSSVTIGEASTWSKLTNGVPVLIKRQGNIFKIWVLYNEPHSWAPSIKDDKKDIYLTEEPTIEFDLTKYSELSDFVNKECYYGYGCYSQPLSIYQDVYFINSYSEEHGSANIKVSTIQQHKSLFSFNADNNTEVKMFFKYKKDNKTYMCPLPFHSIEEDGTNIIIQGAHSQNGDVFVSVEVLKSINTYASHHNNYYGNGIVIAASASIPNIYESTKAFLESEHCNLVLIDSEEKNNFVKNLLLDDKKYFIQGIGLNDVEIEFIDDNGNPMTYFDWDENQPIFKDLVNVLCINENKKWAIVNNKYSDTMGYVLEYKIKHLKDYYNNPKIYYQVLECKEMTE